MKKTLLFSLFSILSLFASAQCDASFGTGDGRFTFTDIETGEGGIQTVTAGNTEVLTLTTMHNIWNETTNDCSTIGGGDDITIIQTLGSVPFDAYGGTALSGDASDKMNITQNSSGLSGTNTHGQLSSSQSSTGDVRCYSIEVRFASHVDILAQDFTLNMSSINTAGEAYESTSVVFLDDSYAPYGSASYNGFWQDADGLGGTHPGVVASCPPAVSPTPNAEADVYSTTGTGVYTISETSTVNVTDPCTPVAATNGTNDNVDVNASTDAGLAAMDPIGGFIFKVYLENIATATADGVDNGTRTRFTSRLDGFEITVASLPVELTTFTGQGKDDNVLLNWKTTTELDNDYFSVEHSLNGADFVEIGTERGAGTTSEITNYAFIHDKPGVGTNYYRLRQVDFDGAFEYSNVIKVRFDAVKNEIYVRPTVGSNQVTLVLGQAFQTQATVQVVDMAGRTVMVKEMDMNTNEMDLDIATFTAGHYFVKVVGNNTSYTTRFVKQ